MPPQIHLINTLYLLGKVLFNGPNGEASLETYVEIVTLSKKRNLV